MMGVGVTLLVGGMVALGVVTFGIGPAIITTIALVAIGTGALAAFTGALGSAINTDSPPPPSYKPSRVTMHEAGLTREQTGIDQRARTEQENSAKPLPSTPGAKNAPEPHQEISDDKSPSSPSPRQSPSTDD